MAARFSALFLCFMAFSGTALAGEASPISFGLIAVQSPSETEALWKPILAGLGRQLHREVRPDIAEDYAGIVWAMRSGQDQLAWTGNKDAMEAVDHGNAEVFAQSVYSSGVAGYHSLLIVRDDSPYRQLDEVFAHAGETTLALGDINSTSGYLVPLHLLFQPRIDPETAFKRVTHGSHEVNFLAVAEGRADFAAIASNHFERIAQDHPEAKVRVLWQSPLLPGDPMLWSRSLPDGTKEQIKAFFVDYGHAAGNKTPAQLAEEQAALAHLGMARFAESSNRQLIPIRKIELLADRQRVEGNGALSEAQRGRRLKRIDRSLEDMTLQ